MPRTIRSIRIDSAGLGSVILKDLLFDAVAFSAIKADKELSIDEEKMEGE